MPDQALQSARWWTDRLFLIIAEENNLEYKSISKEEVITAVKIMLS